MSTAPTYGEKLLAEIAELRARLAEAENTLNAIRNGEVDALVVETAAGPQVYVLQGLDAKESRFRGEILAQVSDAVIVVDQAERVVYLNATAEQLYKVSADKIYGRTLSEIFEARWIDPEDEIIATKELREEGRWRGENLHIKHNAETIYVESSVTILPPNNHGTPPGRLMVIRDITERRRAEAALRAALRELLAQRRAET